MATKHSIAKDLLVEARTRAESEGIAPAGVLEALLTWLVMAMKEEPEIRDLPGLVRSELDSLGSGGVFEIPRGGGHS